MFTEYRMTVTDHTSIDHTCTCDIQMGGTQNLEYKYLTHALTHYNHYTQSATNKYTDCKHPHMVALTTLTYYTYSRYYKKQHDSHRKGTFAVMYAK